MLKHYVRLGFLLLSATSWALAQQPGSLVGTWVGKVQGYDVEMRLVLHADGTADYEGVAGTWRVQGNKLLLSQEGETVAYDFRLQGSQLALSGGDLMAPLVLTRAGGAAPGVGGGGLMPSVQEPEEGSEGPPPFVQEPPQRSDATRPAPGGLAGLGAVAAPPAAPAAKPAGRKRALAESEVVQLIDSGVSSRRLIELVEERGISFSVTPALASKLKAKGATQELIATLRRAGGQQPASAQPPPRMPGAGGLAGLGQVAGGQAGRRPAAGATSGAGGLAGLGQAGGGQYGAVPSTPRAAAPRRPAVPGGGTPQSYDKWGLSFVVPAGWKVGERQGALLLGSDTEPGLMIIRFVRRTSLQTLAEGYQEGMQEEGLQLMPASQLENFSARGGQGLAGELAGTAQGAGQTRARIIGVQTPFGDAVVVMGMTTEEKYAGLKPRVDALAATLSFSQPQAPPVLEAIAGQWFYISSSSFGSSERYLNLCSDGTFSESSEIYSTGDAGTAAGGGGNRAQWTADGDENQGVITVTYPNGETKEIQYQRGGGGLYVEGSKYARYGDGSCTKRSPVYE